MTSRCCTATRVCFIRAPSQTSFLGDTPQVYKNSCGITGDPGYIPVAVGACFPTIHTQHCVGKLAAVCSHPHWQSDWIMPLVLTANFWEAYAEEYEFVHNSHQENTTTPWNPINLLGKEQTDFQKVGDGGKPFFSSSHFWAHILLLRKHNGTQNTSLESLEAAAAQRVWQNLLFPVPPECPAQLLSSCDRFLLALHLQLLLPAAGTGSNRKNRYGQSAAELHSRLWTKGLHQDLKALFGDAYISGSIGRLQQRKQKEKKEWMLWTAKASIPCHGSTLEASGLLFL